MSHTDGPTTFDLHTAVDPRHAIEALSAFGFTEQDLAEATGAHTRTVRRWKSAEAGHEPTHKARQIDDLRNLVAGMAASGAMTNRAIVFWTRSRNRWLTDRRPLDVLASGEDQAYERVRAAAELFVNPHADVAMELLKMKPHSGPAPRDRP